MRIEIEEGLVKQIKERYPETARMKPTMVVDWALRFLVLQPIVERAVTGK